MFPAHLIGSIHGGGALSARVPAGLGIRVDDPPRRFTGSLVLDSHETGVKRQVVADGVLKFLLLARHIPVSLSFVILLAATSP